jgi:hypothetical protein
MLSQGCQKATWISQMWLFALCWQLYPSYKVRIGCFDTPSSPRLYFSLINFFDKKWACYFFRRFLTLSSGVDVTITIFCDFWQFSAEKLAFFSKTSVMIKMLHNLALFWVKNAIFFAEFFGENIQKIITSVPGHPDCSPGRTMARRCPPSVAVQLVRNLILLLRRLRFASDQLEPILRLYN